MKVTVCELHNNPDQFIQDWERLVAHVKAEAGELVLLPEMPFYPWVAQTRKVNPAVWQAAVDAHLRWRERFSELAPAIVLGSSPVNRNGLCLNEGFVWEAQAGYQAAHVKYYLPDEEGFWEASWYERGDGRFRPFQSSRVKIGFMICTDLWFSEHANEYGRAGVQLIASPRATPLATLDKWLVGGRAAAVRSGTFCLSSNSFHPGAQGPDLGGQGWIIGPEGDVLALTSREEPFVTLEIDLQEAERAKETYPRYVKM